MTYEDYCAGAGGVEGPSGKPAGYAMGTTGQEVGLTAPAQSPLQLVPVTFRQAQAFIAVHHRTHGLPRGMRFTVGAATLQGELVGVLVASRPVARHFDDGRTLEVTRSCTDGTANANSLLYGAAARAAFALGYSRVVTYTQTGESGASLRGAGWRIIAERPARGSWAESSVKLRSLRDHTGSGGVQRTLWEKVA